MRNKKNNIKQDILFVLGSSLIVVIAWIGFNIYHIWVTSTIEEKVQMQLTPIDGTFDTTTIQKIKARKQIEPVFTKDASASSTAEATPTLSPTPRASQSAQLNTTDPVPSP